MSISPHENNASESKSSPVQDEVQQSSSKSSRIFTLLKFPKRRFRNSSLSNNRLLKTIDGLIATNKSDNKEAIRKRKEHKSNRCRAFFRYIFCQFIPLHSDGTISIDINNQSTKNSNDDAQLVDDNLQVNIKDIKS